MNLTDTQRETLAEWIAPGNYRAWDAVEAIVAPYVEALATERRINEGFTARLTAALEALARVEALADEYDSVGRAPTVAHHFRAAAALAPATTEEGR